MVYLLFFLSGLAGLVYEISWSRQIGLLFGHTVYAAATVLGAYFGGMALGSWIAARLTRRGRAGRYPLGAYGVAELLVALWALLTPLVLGLLRLPAVTALLNADAPALQTGVRVLAAFAILLPATVPLGATLPFIAQHVSPPSEPGQRRIALAYALNTSGALTGVILTTYVLIMLLGVTGSSYLAAAISGLCGIAALLLQRRTHPQDQPEEATQKCSPTVAASTAWPLILAAVTGFGALGLQVLYTRLFALILHNSTYTFGGIVIGFLTALALAGAYASRTRTDPLIAIRWMMALGTLAIPITVLALYSATGMRYLEVSGGFIAYMAVALGLILLTVGPPVFLLGVVLPLLWRSVAGQSGSVVGRLTALNTLAATVGVMATGFFLLPLAGLWLSFVLITALYAATALAYITASTTRNRVAPALLAGLAILIAGGLLLIPRTFGDRASKLGYKYVFLRDTPYGQIDVLQYQGSELLLRQNRYYRLGSTGAALFEQRQGALPLLLHPNPHRVCFLGLATGITAAPAVVDPAVQHLTAVELIPEVVTAAKLFADYNCGILSSSKAEIVVNDARHYLYATKQRYDLIVSDLFVPWHSQTGYLYTSEHYRIARARLSKGGMFFQWLPAYQLSERELRTIADTFAGVFPVTTVWIDETFQDSPLIGLQGSLEPTGLQYQNIERRSAAIEEALQAAWPAGSLDPLGLGGTELAARYRGTWKPTRAWLNTDEHPRVEFMAPLANRESDLLVGARWQDFKARVIEPSDDVFNSQKE